MEKKSDQAKMNKGPAAIIQDKQAYCSIQEA